MKHFPWLKLSPAVVLAVLAGCGSQPQISQYTVPKEELINPPKRAAAEAGAPQRLIGAIFPVGDQSWFFKATDDPEKIAPLVDSLRTFLGSVRFTSEGEATWTLPDDWSQKPASGLRYATILMGKGSDAPELSVTKLGGASADDETALVVANVNRWLGQIGLPALTPAEIATQTTEIKAGDESGTFVDFTGRATAAGSNMRAPFAGGARPPSAEPDASVDAPAATSLKYETPEGWDDQGAGGLRKASLLVKDGDKQLDVSVTSLSAAGGELLPNVNRWRGQVGLAPTTEEELAKSAETIKLGDVEGKYVELAGPKQDGGSQETILGVIAVRGPLAWFVKAKGDAALAEREKDHFKQFVESIRFE
jgi:hypothetical protein